MSATAVPVARWSHPVAWHPDGRDQPLVDYHAHVVLPGMEGRAGAAGPESGVDEAGCPWYRVGAYRLEGVRYPGTAFSDLELRLASMDELGIDAQVLSPNPLTYFHHVAASTAGDLCRWHNDTLAGLVAVEPARLAGFAQVPIQDPTAAAEETRRAVSDLGLVGPYLGTDIGRDLDDPALAELWWTCEELDVPVFLHPGVQGTDGPLRDPRLRRFDLDLTLGFLYEESIAVAQLVFGGVLHRHPRLRVCLSHGGGATAWLRERWQRAVEVRGWAPEWLRAPGALDDQLRRLWFDAHTGGPISLGVLTGAVGTEHLTFGTNLAGWDAPRPS
jgi:aminocarboxymuconate-semialdehyde decarboxylase